MVVGEKRGKRSKIGEARSC